jgi:tRNA threonylcarbamoyladenosine biosynthesis protein TsaE
MSTTIIPSASAMELFGRSFAGTLTLQPNQAVVLALFGELGSGKTTFIRGLAAGLGISKRIISPTYVLLRSYPVPTGAFTLFIHVDLYRLSNPAEVRVLALADFWEKQNYLLAIEWPEMIAGQLPSRTIRLDFANINEATRRVTIVDRPTG